MLIVLVLSASEQAVAPQHLPAIRGADRFVNMDEMVIELCQVSRYLTKI